MGVVGQPYVLKPIGRAIALGKNRGRYFKYAASEAIFDWSSDLAQIAELCCEPEAIAKACGFADASNERENKAEAAVYVIAVEGLPVCKIGISTCPTRRLRDLQAAHWAGLSIHSVVWFPTRKAESVEQTALRAASEMECRLNGEWVAMDANEATATVLKAAKFLNVPACDSAEWLRNWQRRIDGLREAKAEREEYRRMLPDAA